MNLDRLLPYLPVIGAGLTVLATVLGIAYKAYIGRLKARIRDLAAGLDARQEAVVHLTLQVSALMTERDSYKARSEGFDDLKVAQDKLAAAHADAQGQLKAFEKDATARGNRVCKALELEGAIWTQPVMAGTFKFRPLPDRKTPVVSVLNLKGGFGKTTLTAYLAWALA